MIKVYNSKPEGNAFFHIALDARGGLQPIINARLLWKEQWMFRGLLNVEKIGIDFRTMKSGNQCMFLYDFYGERPYPSVMIMRYTVQGEDIYLQDVEYSDMEAVFYAAEHYLKPEVAQQELTLEELLKELNSWEQEEALAMYKRGTPLQLIKEFFDSL